MSASSRANGSRRRVRGPSVRQGTATRRAARLPAVLAAATVLLQIAYPLVQGAARDRLTVATVVVFFLASTSHAAVWRGARFTGRMVAVSAGLGFLVEALGANLGLPFGAYAYTGQLGPEVLGVPLVIPLAWTMMAYPSLLVGRRISARRGPGVLAAALALATWDLFLDPQMVDAGHWVWLGGGPTLLGIPLSNFAGWLLTGLVMMALLWPPPAAAPGGGDRVPLLLYLWVYASSVLAHLAFFGLPGSALVGGLGMGAVVLVLLLRLRRP